MDRRTKILTAAFGVLVTYGLYDQVVYPRWIEPYLAIDQRIAQLQKEYDRLSEVEEEVKQAKRRYKELVSRTGSFEVGKVRTQVRDRLNVLIKKHKLQDASTTPSRPREDRKTGLQTLVLTVTATGTLQSSIEFFKDLAELPLLSRVTTPAIYPAARRQKERGPTRMNLRVPVEILILPQHQMVGRIDEEELVQVESVVRHLGRGYASIWEGKPFTEYVKPVPLQADAGKDVTVTRPGRRASLSGSVKGGEGELVFKWSPADKLNNVNTLRPTVDTAEAFTETYTLSVTDGTGKTHSDTVEVVVRPKKVAKRDEPPPPPPPAPPTGPKRWKDRKYMQTVMTLITSSVQGRVSELMVYNKKAKQNQYYPIGEEFDGGKLLYVHPTGGLVSRNDEYFIYPIGGWLDQEVKVDDSVNEKYPELKEAADRVREAVEKDAAEAERSKTEAAEQVATETAQKADAAKAKEAETAVDQKSPGVTKGETPKDQQGNAVTPGGKPATKPATGAGKKPRQKNATSGGSKRTPVGKGRKQSGRRSGQVRPSKGRSVGKPKPGGKKTTPKGKPEGKDESGQE